MVGIPHGLGAGLTHAVHVYFSFSGGLGAGFHPRSPMFFFMFCNTGCVPVHPHSAVSDTTAMSRSALMSSVLFDIFI